MCPVVGSSRPLHGRACPLFEKARLSVKLLQDQAVEGVRGDCRQEEVRSVLSTWNRRWPGLLASRVWWPVEPRLAQVLAAGRWWGDVSAVCRRRRAGERDVPTAPLMPGPGLLTAFRKMDGPSSIVPAGPAVAANAVVPAATARVLQPGREGRRQ